MMTQVRKTLYTSNKGVDHHHPQHPQHLRQCNLVRSDILSACCDDGLHVGCSFSRKWLIKIAHETLQIARDGFYVNEQGKRVDVADAFAHALHDSKHYHSSHVFDPATTTKPRFHNTEFHVCYGSSLQVAAKLYEQLSKTRQSNHNNIDNDNNNDIQIGVLNSASGKSPKKFLRGTLSQEEGICRASLLYPCLAQFKNRPHYFYHINNKPKYKESSSSCAIFCPKVPVIREDSTRGHLLDQPLLFSIVSIPAPNAFILGDGSDEEIVPKAQSPGSSHRKEHYGHMTIDAAMHDRIFRALSIFAEQGCTDLVLCAFGCGVHGNSPEKIAQIFHAILSSPELQGRFRVVAFAIQPSRHSNYEEFRKVFGSQ